MPWITPTPHLVTPSFVVGPHPFAELPDLLPQVERIHDALRSLSDEFDPTTGCSDVLKFKPDDVVPDVFLCAVSAHLGLRVGLEDTQFEDVAQRLALRSEWPWKVDEVRTEEGWELHLWADTSYGLVCVWRGKGDALGALSARARREIAEREGPVAMIPRG